MAQGAMQTFPCLPAPFHDCQPDPRFCPPPTVAAVADLVPREVAEQWIKYFREELPAVAFKSSTQKQARARVERGGGAA